MPDRPRPKNATEALGLLRTAASDYEPYEWAQGAFEDGLRFVAELEAALAGQMHDGRAARYWSDRDAQQRTRIRELEAALRNGLDWMEVEHFPWCASLGNPVPGGFDEACDCGRAALPDTEGPE